MCFAGFHECLQNTEKIHQIFRNFLVNFLVQEYVGWYFLMLGTRGWFERIDIYELRSYRAFLLMHHLLKYLWKMNCICSISHSGVSVQLLVKIMLNHRGIVVITNEKLYWQISCNFLVNTFYGNEVISNLQ